MPGRYEQSSVVVNYVYTLTENAKHLAYIVSSLRERGARLFDVAEDAEVAWVKGVVEGSATGSGVPRSVHSWPQQQGRSSGGDTPGEPELPRGAGEALRLLEAWRADRGLAGYSSGIRQGRRPMECVEIVPGFVAEMKDVDLKLEVGRRPRGGRHAGPGPVAGRRLSGPGC